MLRRTDEVISLESGQQFDAMAGEPKEQWFEPVGRRTGPR